MLRPIFVFLAFLAPTQAFAFDFGFVRAPDWMDQYMMPLLAIAAVCFVLTVMFKPRGVPIREMREHFKEFSITGRVFYAGFGVSFSVLMVMVFVGMGLQRYAEAGV